MFYISRSIYMYLPLPRSLYSPRSLSRTIDRNMFMYLSRSMPLSVALPLSGCRSPHSSLYMYSIRYRSFLGSFYVYMYRSLFLCRLPSLFSSLYMDRSLSPSRHMSPPLHRYMSRSVYRYISRRRSLSLYIGPSCFFICLFHVRCVGLFIFVFVCIVIFIFLVIFLFICIVLCIYLLFVLFVVLLIVLFRVIFRWLISRTRSLPLSLYRSPVIHRSRYLDISLSLHMYVSM